MKGKGKAVDKNFQLCSFFYLHDLYRFLALFCKKFFFSIMHVFADPITNALSIILAAMKKIVCNLTRMIKIITCWVTNLSLANMVCVGNRSSRKSMTEFH